VASRWLLGIDIGTTATKAILLHADKGILATAERQSTLQAPHPGWAEADPEEWWTNVARVCRACLKQADIPSGELAGIGVSGMVPTLILLDKSCAVLYPSIQQNDARAFQEIRDLQASTNETEILTRTGSPITQQSIGPKLLWLRRHRPGVIQHAAHLMGAYDFIIHRLTGSFSIERNWALESGLFDLHKEDWDQGLLVASTAAQEWLGPVHPPHHVVGQVTEAAGHLTGLAPGIPVVAGSADHVASAFSAGINSPGDLLVKLGGAGDILYSLDRLVIHERLYLDYHIIPQAYLLNGCMAASGSIIKWFRQELASGADYAELDKEGELIAPGSDELVVLPYFLGEKTPLNDPLARGVLFGLTLSHSRAHIFRAILEGISFGFRHHLEVLSEQGLRVTRARVTNGGARSRLWKTVTSDVLGIPLEEIAQHPGSSLGAAFVAGMGVGVFSDWRQIERFVEVTGSVEPDPVSHDRYEKLYAVYRDLYGQLQGQFLALQSIRASAT
jgi:xylulokinase